jgi:two-component system OmpR family sensor kinase
MKRPRWLTRYYRLPIRARLTIAFVAVMGAVLVAAGAILYAQFRSDLDAQINSALRTETADVEALVDAGGPRAIGDSGAPLAQVFSPRGELLASTRKARPLRLLSPEQAGRAALSRQPVRTLTLPSGPVRVLTETATTSDGRQLALAVADQLRLRDHELGHLRSLLLTDGPLALLLAGLAGYALARAALRPVDRMRAKLERMSDRAEPLPVPPTSDEIGALANTLNALLARVRTAAERERRLVSDASHELRTPLTTLRAEIDLALMGDRDPDELRTALESAAQEARRMSRLADDLLVLARADQGRLPLHPLPQPPVALLEAAATRARAAAGMRGRSIVVEPVEFADDVAVLADPDRTAQALGNLITNALLYGDGTVTLSAVANGRLIELHVLDEGDGFSGQELGRAFERFGRGDSARGREPGSGLGLAIVEAVAVAHGGLAQAQNRPDGGADVWIAIPRSPVPAVRLVAPA